MASLSTFSFLISPVYKAPPKSWFPSTTTVGSITIRGTSIGATSEQIAIRRSANYKPPTWGFDQVQSLKNKYYGQEYEDRSRKLKEQVKLMLKQEANWLYYLELIDDLQRLGLFYHFENEFRSILSRMQEEISSKTTDLNKKDLYTTALFFRLLRQHNFEVPPDVFDRFKDEKDEFDAKFSQDTKGLLQLYEACFYLQEKEATLELAREFAIKHLKMKLDNKEIMDGILEESVIRALIQPFHWRMLRLEAREFIDIYEQRADVNTTLLELAKLDFNLVQAAHLNDLKYISIWWKGTHLAEKLPFSRDRLVENFFWTIGIHFEPQFEYCRRMSTKVNALITTIDDVYDVYGTLDELELFTATVQKWDKSGIDQLPGYMKHCYMELYNSTNEMADVILQEQGLHIISYLKNSWAELCEAFLKEAKWYYSGYVPTLEEYLENAWISASAPVILVHGFFFLTNSIKNEVLKSLDPYQNIIRCSAMILRLANDLGTSWKELERGDVPKSVQCYMTETGATEENAREHIKFLIGETWKQMNKEVADKKTTPFSKAFNGMAVNVARIALYMYQNGDGHGHQDSITKSRISALLFEPINLPC